jgi:hypothetical protein
VLINFLIRVALIAADGKDASAHVLSEQCVALLADGLAVWADANIKLAYFEKQISQANDQLVLSREGRTSPPLAPRLPSLTIPALPSHAAARTSSPSLPSPPMVPLPWSCSQAALLTGIAVLQTILMRQPTFLLKCLGAIQTLLKPAFDTHVDNPKMVTTLAAFISAAVPALDAAAAAMPAPHLQPVAPGQAPPPDAKAEMEGFVTYLSNSTPPPATRTEIATAATRTERP